MQMLYQLSTYFTEYALYDQAENIPDNPWTPCCSLLLNIIKVCFLQTVDCGACSEKVKALNM